MEPAEFVDLVLVLPPHLNFFSATRGFVFFRKLFVKAHQFRLLDEGLASGKYVDVPFGVA